MKPRTWVLLQGVCSPFFARLAQALQAAGVRVLKLNFNAGDCLYWGARSATHCRVEPAQIGEFFAAYCVRHGVTDLLVFGDRRPVHQQALASAAQLGVRSHVLEEGYFRPYWFTLEGDGVNRHSRLPRDPHWYHAVAPSLPPVPAPQTFHQPFATRALHDVAYHVAGLLNPLVFPHYRTHAELSAPLEYAGYLRRYLRLRARHAADAQRAARCLTGSQPYFFLPLQLNGDAQIRDHSPFTDMHELLDLVLKSFARHAPSNTLLVVKNHPLDYSWQGHERQLQRLLHQYDLVGRVVYLETGDLLPLVMGARGVVTVNSTVGSLALELARPTLALAAAIYHLPGLTFQGSLDDFWGGGEPPEATLFDNFRRTVMYATQINGGFYTAPAIALAVAQLLPALLRERTRLDELLASTPPLDAP